MTLTEAAREYRHTQDVQEEIENMLMEIDDAEYELNERRKQLQKELKAYDKMSLNALKDDLHFKRKASLQMRVKEIDAKLADENVKAERLDITNKSMDRIQDDLERIFGRKILSAEYDRIYHSK